MKYGKYIAAAIIILVAGIFAIRHASGIKNIFQAKAIGSDSASSTDIAGTTEAGQSQCSDSTDKFKCYKDYYTKLVHDKGVAVAFADLKEKYKVDPFVVSQCHPLTHVIGREGAKSYKTVGEAYLYGDSFCWSGYYHGVMEEIGARYGLDDFPKVINKICDELPGKATYNFDYFNCVHGLGHSVMELQGDDVPKSLAMCDYLSGDWEKQSCYGGVFMENIISYNLTGVSNYLSDTDLMYPCTMVGDKYKGQCYLGQTSHALAKSGYVFKTVFDMCTKVEGGYRDICNQSMGRDVANQAIHEPVLSAANCAIATEKRDRENCIMGAAKEFVSNFHDDKLALDFCTATGKGYKEYCVEVVKNYYQSFK